MAVGALRRLHTRGAKGNEQTDRSPDLPPTARAANVARVQHRASQAGRADQNAGQGESRGCEAWHDEEGQDGEQEPEQQSDADGPAAAAPDIRANAGGQLVRPLIEVRTDLRRSPRSRSSRCRSRSRRRPAPGGRSR